jgi:A/G-specific adenine glycosylase
MAPVLPDSTGPPVAAYRDALVAWYRRHARDLPWRRSRSPHGVWVSEIMLQQTRVEAVLPRWEAFLERFPDAATLAAAPLERVLEAWSGLGYYRRARLLHAAARAIVERHGGEFPEEEAAVAALPGIGRYTAGAILSIAFGKPTACVDGNAARVLARVFGVRGDVARAPASHRLWRLAGEVVAEGDPGEVNQAQMELGATVCRAAAPGCEGCPIAGLCFARREGVVHELPEKRRRRAAVDVARVALLVRRGPDVLLRKRREGELLPGMWDLPGAFTGEDGDRSGRVEDALSLLPFQVRVGEVVGRWKHAITHRRIALEVREASEIVPGDAREGVGPDGAALVWCHPAEGMQKALSSPARRVLQRAAATPA